MTNETADRAHSRTILRSKRVRRPMIALVVVGMLILFTGCAVHLDPTRVAPERWLEPPEVSAQAQQLYSKEQLNTAYEEITQLTFDKSFEASLLNPQQRQYTAEQLNAGIRERMTPAMGKHWDEQVAAALSGDDAAKDGVRLLRFFDWEQPDWNLPKSGRPLLGQQIHSVEIDVSPTTPEKPQRLKITLVIEASLEYQEANAHFPVVVSKRISHWLLPTDGSRGFAWNLDEYEGVFAAGLPLEQDAPIDLPAPPPSQEEDPSKDLGEAQLDLVAGLTAIPAGQAEQRERFGFGTASSAADAPPTSPKVAVGGFPLLRPSAVGPSPVNQRLPAMSQSSTKAEPPLTTRSSATVSTSPSEGTFLPRVTSQPPRTMEPARTTQPPRTTTLKPEQGPPVKPVPQAQPEPVKSETEPAEPLRAKEPSPAAQPSWTRQPPRAKELPREKQAPPATEQPAGKSSREPGTTQPSTPTTKRG